MTLPTTGTLTLAQINAEFGLGTNLYAYRGVKWYRDDNSRGYFDQAMGNNPPIDMLEFYGKRKTIPVVASGPTAQANGSYFSVPFYNKITIVVKGGTNGGTGANGYYQGGPNAGLPTGGSGGTAGGSSQFGSYGSAGSGGTTTIVFNAESDPNAPLKGIPILNTVGAAGVGGKGGDIWNWESVYNIFTGRYENQYVYRGDAAQGANGSPGSITIKVE